MRRAAAVADLNVPRIGRAMKIAALDKPAYDGTLNGEFDVSGSVPRTTGRAAASRTSRDDAVDARGTLRDSTFMGGRLPQLTYETQAGQRRAGR